MVFVAWHDNNLSLPFAIRDSFYQKQSWKLEYDNEM